MAELRLAKLPDRVPVKLSISVAPGLHAALTAYADAYQAAYGSAESIAELIPYMLAAFIESDNGFRKVRRDRDVAPKGSGRDLPSRVKLSAPASSSDPKDGNLSR